MYITCTVLNFCILDFSIAVLLELDCTNVMYGRQ